MSLVLILVVIGNIINNLFVFKIGFINDNSKFRLSVSYMLGIFLM